MQNSFEQLQNYLAKNPDLVAETTRRKRTLVYIAGMSLDQEELAKVRGIEFYEERLLYVVGLLRDPNTKIVFVSSKQIDPVIIDYYFDLFSRSQKERISMEKRWHHFYIGNSRIHKTLTQKVLTSKRLVIQINQQIDNTKQAVLRCFNSSEDEKALAVKLNIPLYAPDPKFLHYGSKSGARQVFKQAGLKPPYGVENITSMLELINSIRKIKQHEKGVEQVVVKFDYSFSGVGNANLTVSKFPRTNVAAEKYIKTHLKPNESDVTAIQYLKKLFDIGGIVETWLQGIRIFSPSVQLAIDPDKSVRIISSHEQLLDEETKQVFLGARFPARKSMRQPLLLQAEKVGKELADAGVIGFFGIDFIAVKEKTKYVAYPIEINLRKGGATHPFQIARMLTQGSYKKDGAMRDDSRQRIAYYSFDNIKSTDYVGLKPEEIIKIVKQAGLEFDHENNGGVSLHLLGSLKKYGKFGTVCIARSPRAAEQLFIILTKVVDAYVARKSEIEIVTPQVVSVNQKRLVDTFIKLVKIASPSGEEAKIRLLLREELVRLGVKTRVDKSGNLIGKKPGVGTVPFLLSAHMDTVKPCENVNPVIRGNTIMTDGTTILGADNKAGIVYILELLRLLHEFDIKHRPLEIVMSVCEEQFSGGADELDVSKLKSPVGLVVDGADLGEVDYISPYIATINVSVIGKAAHSGVEPENGVSAIQIASNAIANMPLGRLDHDTTANIGLITGGTNRNAIPDRVELEGEVRSLTKRYLEEQLERMHKALEDAAELYGGLLDISSKIAVQGYKFSKNDPDLKKIMQIMKEVDIKPDLRKAGGGSDANVFVARGIKTIDVGTGVQKPHTVEESIKIDDMTKMVEFLLKIVQV
ncbi:MAG: M20/M25/M40 family metallo-hydrolase [bacterium]|nr:M20/M25/M40 family metallo-hydrolase [bacterium]